MSFKHVCVGFVSCGLILVSWVLVQFAIRSSLFAPADPSHRPNLEAAYGKLPLSFEVNQGQTDEEVRFVSRGHGYALFLTPTEAVLTRRNSPAGKQPDTAERQTQKTRAPVRRVSPRSSCHRHHLCCG